MRFFLSFILLVAIALLPQTAPASQSEARAHPPVVPEPQKLISDLDELAAKFDPTVCGECHVDIYEQWKHSPKSHSFSTERVLQTWRTFIKQGLEREKHLSRMDIKSHCLWCHAPHIKYATDELVSEIIDMIIDSVDAPDKAEREAAVKELSKLNLNCYGCHNLFSVKDGYWGNKPETDTLYGPTGDVDQETHQEFVPGIEKTLKSDYLTSVKFCARCHHGCPDFVPFWQCRTLYTSYVENYALKGGEKRCQDCHMEKDEDMGTASHSFPGVHDKEFFGDAIDIEIDAEISHFINNYENELTPTLCLDVIVTSNSGHGLPNG